MLDGDERVCKLRSITLSGRNMDCRKLAIVMALMTAFCFVVPSPVEARSIVYYGVDRALQSELSFLGPTYHVSTLVASIDVNRSSSWRPFFDEAAKYNINIVIWPSDWTHPRPDCGWESPYFDNNGDYITHVKNLLDAVGDYPNFIGIVNAHEPFWSCKMTMEEMAIIRTQLKDYIRNHTTNHREVKVWNYVDNIVNHVPSNATPEQINSIMDVAVTWQHCFGGAEGSCPNALNLVQQDRARINNAGLEGKVELVYLFQTFAYGSNYVMPTSEEMENWGCQFANSGPLDGFIWYTWGAKWYTEDLDDRPDLWPSMNYVYENCVSSVATPSPGPPRCWGNDSQINGDDVKGWLENFLGINTRWDVNGDSKVNTFELGYLVTNWGKDCSH